jgi:hypothetical protein
MIPTMKKKSHVALWGMTGAIAAAAVAMVLYLVGVLPSFPDDAGKIAIGGFLAAGGAGVVKDIIEYRRRRGASDT